MGTPDANSRTANMVGSVRFGVLNGNPSTPADEADVTIEARVTDVRTTASLNDYTGELEGRVSLRITDRLNGTGQNEGAHRDRLALLVCGAVHRHLGHRQRGVHLRR